MPLDSCILFWQCPAYQNREQAQRSGLLRLPLARRQAVSADSGQSLLPVKLTPTIFGVDRRRYLLSSALLAPCR
jgi:hypothetical protein